MEPFKLQIKTLTPLWTGGVDGNCDRIHETGIIGSLRWWYEALVRGLDGYACDPTSNEACYLDNKKFKKAVRSGKKEQQALNELICPACQLFGCTGWGKKVKFEVTVLPSENFQPGTGPYAGLKKNSEFQLKINSLKETSNVEKWLFVKTLEVIQKYGAIGGRTTWKPGNKLGTSYGRFKVLDYNGFDNSNELATKNQVLRVLKDNKDKLNKQNSSEWFNFKFFWVLENDYLKKGDINKFVNRYIPNPQNYDKKEAGDFDKWLGGEQGVSKKIFSFEKNTPLVFGYVKNEDELEKIKEKLRNLDKSLSNFKIGKGIMEELQ